MGVAVLVVLLAWGTSVATAAALGRIEGRAPAVLPGLPAPAPGWAGPHSGLDGWEPVFAGALREEIGAYLAPGGDQVDAYVVSYGIRGRGRDVISSTNTLFQPDRWRQVSPAGSRHVIPGVARVAETVLRSGDDAGRLIWSWYRIGPLRTLSPVMVKLRELRVLAEGGNAEKGLVALSASFEDDPDQARRLLVEFLARTCTGGADCVLSPAPARH